MKPIQRFMDKYWRQAAIALVVLVAGYFMFFHGLSNMTPAYSQTEIVAQGSSTSLRAIWHDPVNAPFKLLLWAPFKMGHHSLMIGRIVAATIGFMSAVLFYFVLYSLFSPRIAALGGTLFLFSSGLLYASHLGTPLILQIFGMIMLLSLLPAYMLLRGKVLPLYLGAAIIALLLYVPGMIWFIIVAAAVLGKRAIKPYRELGRGHQTMIMILASLLLLPLLWACVTHLSVLLAIFGLPAGWPAWHDIVTRAGDLGRSLFWSGQGPAEIMLVGAPILNVIELGLLFVGIAVQFKAPRLRSNFFVIGATLFITLLIIVGGSLNYVALTPALYLLMAGGVFYLLSQWSRVFPVNPVAHLAGLVAVTALVMTSVLFHFRTFYIARPHSTATHAAFSVPQPTTYYDPNASSGTEGATF